MGDNEKIPSLQNSILTKKNKESKTNIKHNPKKYLRNLKPNQGG